ncbi:MAG TPA: YajQ family cyclic di-GMP-binding protein [Candidatus Handelsmanbacteria bacterium]|nr:YajQ family cyclic di-GMP-binding protein [Candidatus Handelsmanbacteria bacterium]
MPSFDIVNEVDLQEVDNAVNNTKKEVTTRYDFRDSKTEIDFNRKEKVISLQTKDEMMMQALYDVIISHFVRRKVDPKCLDFGEIEGTSQGHVKRVVRLQEGIEREIAQKIVKLIKGLKIKVQPAIQDDQVRVTGKKVDDLQAVMGMLKNEDMGIPLQFGNMKK